MSLHRRKPRGAVTFKQARASKGPWYFVYREHGLLTKTDGWLSVIKNFTPNHDRILNGEIHATILGWCFLDYFSALAYSLKRWAAWGHDK